MDPSLLLHRYGFDLPPEDTKLLRGPLPGAARQWVRDAIGPGARIVSEHPRAGGTSSAIHGVTVDDAHGVRSHLVLRRYVRQDWLAREPDLAEHEARVLALLEPSRVSAPHLVAVDPSGGHCDVPAVLMTRLPGRIRWTSRDLDGFLTGLVDAMVTIHAVDVPDSVTIRPFTPYDEGQLLEPPPGTSCPEAWACAIEVHAGPPPVREHRFIHRDFHPGNVLWRGDSVTGVVDWCNASLGSPEADVGHCRINLARTFGHDAAEHLTARYLERSGRDGYDPYWDLVDAVGMLDLVETEFVSLPALDDFVSPRGCPPRLTVPDSVRDRVAVTTRSRTERRRLLGHLRDGVGEGLVPAAALLSHHELGHVALDLDLAGHEGLHPRLRIAGDEDVLRGRVVGGEGHVGVVDEADAHLGLAVLRAHVHVTLVAERRARDHDVDDDRVPGGGVRAVLGDELLDLGEPFVGEERELGHWSLLDRWSRTDTNGGEPTDAAKRRRGRCDRRGG